MRVAGGCHCGAVRFAFESDFAVELLECNCSICRHTAYLHLIVPHERFELISGVEVLASYRFGSGAADHLFCRGCGVKSFYQPRSHPGAWSVNFRSLDAGHGLSATVREFDGSNWEDAREQLG